MHQYVKYSFSGYIVEIIYFTQLVFISQFSIVFFFLETTIDEDKLIYRCRYASNFKLNEFKTKTEH